MHYKCEVCGKPATVNYQRVWTRYPIEGEYFGVAEPLYEWTEDEPNRFFCEEHDRLFRNGAL